MTHPIAGQLVTDGQLQSIHQKIATNPAVAAGWKAFETKMRTYDAAKLAEMKAHWEVLDARAKEFGGLKVFSRGNYLRLMAYSLAELAFHFKMTGEKSSGEGARMIGNWIAGEPKWLAQGAQNGWIADLWTADFSAAMGVGFRFAEGALPPEDVQQWSSSISHKGIEPLLADWIDPKTRIHALDSMGHNWWAVCVSGAAVGLFAVRDTHPKADSLLHRIGDNFVEFFDYPGNVLQNKHRNFGATGEFIEPLGYLDFTLHNAIFMFDLYRDHLGRDLAAEVPVLEKICDYYMANLETLEGKIYRPNFGNMNSGADSIGAYNHYPAPAWLWLANRFQRDDLFYLVKKTRPEPTSFLEFLFWPDQSKGKSFAGAPGCCVFESTGEAVLRDGYEDTSTFFTIKTGENWNHNHADAGTYILCSGGREFIIDAGTTEYSNPLVYSYFKKAESHNVILHDGRGPRDEIEFLGTKHMGKIAAQLFGADYRYLLADATGPWEGVYHRFYRHVLWISDFIVMVDDLMATHAAPWTQLLHYRGNAETRPGLTTIDHNGKVLKVHHLFPTAEKIETRTGYLSAVVPNPTKYEYKITETPYLAFHYPGPDRREKFIQVFELPDGREKKIGKIEAPGISGVRISTADDVWEVICNHDADGRKMHQNSHVKFGSLETDAFLVVVHRSSKGTLRSLGIHNGSYVRSNGTILYSALLKSDVHLVYESNRIGIESSLTAPAWTDFAAEESPDRLRRLHLPAGPSVIWMER